jgi:hypothetical protein
MPFVMAGYRLHSEPDSKKPQIGQRMAGTYLPLPHPTHQQ